MIANRLQFPLVFRLSCTIVHPNRIIHFHAKRFPWLLRAGAMTVTLPDGTAAYTTALPFGVTRLLMGFVFSLGLILVVVGGAELFTGNNLIVMAWASGKVSGFALLRNWIILTFVQAVALGILCNALVCLAVWLRPIARAAPWIRFLPSFFRSRRSSPLGSSIVLPTCISFPMLSLSRN